VLLKAGSTVYRFTRYYTGAPGYRRKGPPSPLLRLLGPFVLGLSLAVIASGGMLAITGPSGRMWLLVHKASFMLWLVGMSIHVLAYVKRLPHLIGADLTTRASTRAQEVLAGRAARWLLVTASVLAGLAAGSARLPPGGRLERGRWRMRAAKAAVPDGGERPEGP